MSIRMKLFRSRPIRFYSKFAMKCWTITGIFILSSFLTYMVYGGVITFFLLLAAIAGVLYHKEDELLYHPELPTHSRLYVPSPSVYNLPYQSIYTPSEDGTMLHMFFITQPEDKIDKVPTFLFLHGNAGNIGHRLQNVVGLYHNVQCNILLLEYRGYGHSKGSPSEEGLCKDARAGLNYLISQTNVNINEIVVFGRSLGGAVAIDLAMRPENLQRIWCLIVENTFTSIPDMAMLFVGSKVLRYMPLFIYKNKYLSISKIGSVRIPTLFISGLADTLVPPCMMENLYKKSRSSYKRLVPVNGGTHNETWCQSEYYDNINKFLAELRQNPPLRESSSHWQIDDI